ncbi:MAG: hypothetical protein L0Z73_17220 [Gammaproteobacteria bacterium]|nr:hypothetical protein [Gammaproteobacteria bacterium]
MLVLWSAGCNAPMPDLDLEPEVNKLFSSLQAKDVDAALTFYSQDFYKGIPREAWALRLRQFLDFMGPIEAFKIRSRQADTRYSGKFFIYQLETRHEGDKKARHIVTFILPVDGSDVKLIGHKITAKGFEQ